MVFLNRTALRILWVTVRAAAPSLFLLTGLWNCARDYDTPWIATAPGDSITVSKGVKPVIVPKDTTPIVIKPPDPILITAVTAADMRLLMGETSQAVVGLAPDNATSPVYEMTSSRPAVAEVRPEGIHGILPGTATITVHTLDGSEKIARFKVTVDPIIDVCLGLCGCDGEGKPKTKGKDCGDG